MDSPARADTTLSESRRSAMRGIIAMVLIGASASELRCAAQHEGIAPSAPFGRPPLAAAAKAADPFKHEWGPDDLAAFLSALPATELAELAAALEVKDTRSPPYSASERNAIELSIRSKIVSDSSHTLTAPFKDKERVQYDEIVRWTAAKFGVPSAIAERASTFELEQRIGVLFFAEVWDGLSPEKRLKWLDQIDPNSKVFQNRAVVTARGSDVAQRLVQESRKSGRSVTAVSNNALRTALIVLNSVGGAVVASGSLMLPLSLAPLLIITGRADPARCAAIVSNISLLRARAWDAAGKKLPDIDF